MKAFIRFFAQRHLLANLMTIMIILAGIGTLAVINRSQYPPIDMGRMGITTRYPGASAEDVEQNVTNKIEDELKSVTGIDNIKSISMESISQITVIIEQDVKDKESVKDDIREAINRVTDFPEEVTESPNIIESKSANMPIIEVGFSGDIPYPELRELARRFEIKLKKVPGVARLDRYGYLAREIKVEISPDKIRDYQISLREITSAIQARNIRATGGSIKSYTSEKDVVTLAQFRNPIEVGDVVVRTAFDGPLIKLKDLAIVTDSFEEERIISRMNGKPAISFVVIKNETADIIRTVDAIKNLVEKEREILPEGVEVLYTSDVSKTVSRSLDIVSSNGLIGMAFILILLAIFLNFRTAFWVAMGIPISLFGAVFLLPFFDTNINVIVLSAMILVIGIIVDDAIIIAENIYRRLELGDNPLDATVNGLNEVIRPVTATILTTIVAFIPILFLPGFVGQVANVMPKVIILALLVSLVESVIALPAHLTAGLQKKSNSNPASMNGNWFEKVRKWYQQHFAAAVLRFRYVYLFLAIIIFGSTILYTTDKMDFILFPSEGAEELIIRAELPIGVSLEASSEKVKEIEEIVAQLPKEELSSFVTRVGVFWGEIPVEEGENRASIVITLTPFSERSRNADEIREYLRAKTDKLEGFENIIYYVHVGGPPVGKPVSIRLVGSDNLIRRQLADDVEKFLKSVEGVTDIERDDILGKEQVEVKINYDKLARMGLTVADIAQNVRIAYDGQVVTRVRYGDEDVEFRVMLEEGVRKQINYLRELLIPNNQGRLIPLRDVAYLKTGPGPNNFRHDDNERSTTVQADVLLDKVTALEVIESIQNNFNLDRDYPGIRFIIGGQVEEQMGSMISMIILFGIALLGIYFILILQFNSVIQPVLVLAAVPFGFVGVVIAFALNGQPLSFFAMLGLLGLSGVVVNDSLVLISHINDLRIEKPEKNLLSVVAEGAANRLRPILLTTFTTVVGLLPLAYGLGGYDEIVAPLALALGYGLLFATPLTLILVPSLYMIENDIRKIGSRFSMALKVLFRGPEETV